MKNFNLFDKLFEQCRTLRRVGMVLVMCLTVCGNAWADGSGYGFEDNDATTAPKWVKNGGTCSIVTEEHRTGSYSGKHVPATGSSGKRADMQNIPVTFKGGKHTLHYIAYVKKNSTADVVTLKSVNFYAGSAFASYSFDLALTTSWQRITYKGVRTGNTSNYTDVNLYFTTATADKSSNSIYVDDVVVYATEEDEKTDLKKPNSATITANTEEGLTWTNGTDESDATYGATGIQKTLIWKRTSGTATGLSLNDQGIYSTTSSEGPSTDESGDWTLVSVVNTGTTSYSTSLVEGHHYAIVHRDLAYNYSTPVYTTIEASCTAPSSVTVDATGGIDGNYGWRYTTGETIDLTCTATGGSGEYSYQWQKYVNSAWTDIVGATSARYQKASCTYNDGGSYRCVVSTGEGCSKGSDEALGHGYYVRVFTLDGNYYGSAWNKNAIIWTGENTGTVTLSLEKSRTFEFKVRDNDQKEFGYTAGNYIIQPWSNDCGAGDGTNIRLFTGPAGDYTITLNVEHANDVSAYVNVDVAYPSVTHPADGYVYLTKWSWDPYVHYWDGSGSALTADGSDPKINTYTEICEGDYYWYFPVLDNYVNFLVKDNTKESSATNKSGSQTTTDHSGMLLTNTGSWVWQNIGKTISFDANGGSGTMDDIEHICSGDDKTLPTNTFTRTGWEFDGWNTNKYGSGDSYDDGATIEGITSDITLYAQWKKTVYMQATGDLTWWYNANAWFVVWCTNSDESESAWVAMEKAENCSDPAIYKATIPGNGWTKFTFVRKDPADKTVIGWGNKWNHTSKEADPTTNNKFTITGGSDDNCTGSWGSYSTPTFTISYNKGTNGTGTKDNESKTCSVDFTLPGGTFTYDGHSQDGWATSDGGTKAYNLSGSYTTNVAQTFYPHWKCNTPEISCSSGTVTITVPSGAKVYYTTTTDGSEPADPTSSSSEYDPESKPTISEDTKIKAIAIQDGCTSSEIASEDLEYVDTYTVTYTTTGSTSGSAPTDINSPYTSGSTVTVLGNAGSLVKTGNVFLGWSDGSGNNYAPGETFTISRNTTLSPIWKDGTSATVTYTMAVGSQAWSASGSSNETTGIPNAGVTITTTNAGIDGNGTGSDDKARTSKLAIKTGANGATYDSPTNYILYNFSVASGYAFTPSDITIKIANVGSSSANNIKYKAVLSDESSHSISTTYICTTGDGTVETFHLYNEEGVAFDGNVSLKLWAWTIENISNGGSNYRLGTPLTIAGVTESTCSTPADPDGLAVGSITSSGATFTITDDESPASYEIYYSTSSTAPTSGTAASATTTSKTKAVTGLDPSTTYYAWVRAVCNASYKSDWVALTESSFETEVMSLPATLDKSNVTAVSDDTYWSDDNTYYDYGSTDATNTSRYQDWEVNVIPCTYEVSVVMNTSGDGDGTQWGLQLLDAEEKVIASYNSVKAYGETSKTYDAKWDLTKIVEGVYTLRVKNIFSFAQPKLKSLTLDASIYTITYDANGGTCGTESETVCGGGVTLPIPTKAGYACIGWYNSSDVKQGDAGGDYEPDNDITLYAHWAAMPTVSDLEIDYTNATATSIPLSWTIPGKIDLSTASFDDSDPDYFISSQKPADSKSYDSSSEELTVTYTATQWAQKGVALPFAETNLESVTYEYKGHRVFPAVVKSDGSTLYWDYDIVTTADDWTKVTRTPSRIYSNAGTVSPLPTAKAITFCANPNADKTDESFYIRNVFYHLQDQADVDHVVLMRKEGSAATDTTDASATKLYSGKKSHFTDNTAVAGKAYYYTVFTVHASGVVSTGVSEHLTIYTITYDKGANGAGTIADGKKTGQIDFTLTGTRFTRDHYIQDGWSELDGGAKVYEMSGTYSTDDDITLYPHWVNLDLHQPGVYEKPESLGGYGRPLKLISSHDYEVYFMTQDTVDEANHGALYAGPKDTKISLGKEMFKEAAANTEIKGDGWMAFHMATSICTSEEARIGSALSGTEFFIADGGNSDGAKDSRYAEILSGNYIRLRISGYDQFSFCGSDYSGDDQFTVRIDGVKQSYTHNNSGSRNIFRFNISTGEHFIEITANGTGEHYCKFRGFSLRLPDVTRYTVSAESNNDSYGAVSASSVTNVRSGSTLYVSSNTFTVNGTTITATPESNTAEYSYAFNNWTIDSSPVTTTATISAVTTVTANFTQTANSYSLSWSTDGDDLTGDYTSGTVAYGTSITEPNTPTKTGYTFDAWSPAFTGTMPAANTEYVAQWTINSHTLTWDFGGGSTSDDDYTAGGSVDYNTTLDYPADNTMSKSGYDFAGWSTDASTMPDEDLTITAQWATKYTVTFNAMTGGSVTPTSAQGSSVTKVILPTPTHDDYTFDGWYNTAGTKIGNAGDKINPTANVTLYAKWKGDCAAGDPVLFYQTFNSDGAGSVAYAAGTAMNYTKDGTTISGIVGSGANLFTQMYCKKVNNTGIGVNSSTGGDSEDWTGKFGMYASGNNSEYHLIRSTNLASTAPTAIKVEFNALVSDEGNNSKTIFMVAVGSGFSDETTSSYPSKDNVYTGFGVFHYYNSSTHTVDPCSYLGTGQGNRFTTTGTITYNSSVKYTWVVNATGDDLEYDDPSSGTTTLATGKWDLWIGTTKVVSAQDRTTAKDVTLAGTTMQNLYIGCNDARGKFVLDDFKVTDLSGSSSSCYTVTYHGNNATSGFVDDPAQYAAGSSVSAKYNSAISGFERTGYEFVEWNTAANGSGDAYKPFARITSSIADDINLYAQWRIVIDANNTDFAGKDDPTQYRDVKVTKGATLTLTQNTAVRDIIVETGSTLNVNTTNGDGTGDGVTLATNSLSLVGGWGTVGNETKYDMPRVYIDQASKITKTVKTINFDIAVDNRNFYPIAVPFPVTVSDVDYVNATLAYYSNYGTSGQYVIKTYNGQARANADMSNCWRVMRDGVKHYVTSSGEESEVMVPGQGYILRALPASGYGDYAVIRFPMKNVDDEWTNGGEKGVIYSGTEDEDSKNAVSVVAYENESGDTKLSNKGWNILGVPYMTCFVSNEIESDETNAYIKGLLNITTGEYTEDGNVYVTVPKHDFSEYDQLNFSEAKLLPGWCFFVQMDKDATLTFDKDGERASAPFRATMYEHKPTVKTGIILSGAEASDKTTILVSDKYSAVDYEINADLEKMFGENSYTLATYSLAGTTRLAYNAMSNSDATNVIPIGYRAPADGEYTFAINPRYAENGAFEHVNLIDYETGFVTDLLVSSYSFATERTQNDERFALNVVKRQDVITDIGNGEEVNGERTNGVQKVIINDKLYIIVDGRMYSAEGALVK